MPTAEEVAKACREACEVYAAEGRKTRESDLARRVMRLHGWFSYRYLVEPIACHEASRLGVLL